MATAWDFIVDRENLRAAAVVEAPDSVSISLADGEVLLAIERFALTANNITYGKIGDRFGYWRFFPAPEGKGRIPAWGTARVIRSATPDVAEGQRLYGYLPMSTHLVARLAPKGAGFVDLAPHREGLPPVYNQYEPIGDASPLDDYRALLGPLVITSFLIADYFEGQDLFGAGTVILSSASSKTAMGLAWLLRRQGGVKVIGLSSPANAVAVEGFGLYDHLVPYDQAASVEVEGTALYVDFAGDAAITAAIHHALGDRLARSLIVGGAHWEARGFPADLPGPTPELFFAPDHVRRRTKDWGHEGLQQRFAAMLQDFVAANPWLSLETHHGAPGVAAAYRAVLEGEARPHQGLIVTP